jgi:hypothetical protein
LVFATKFRRPLSLIYYEAFVEEADAKKREKYLKGGNGKKEIAVMLEKYFSKHPWQKEEIVADVEVPEMPPDALICPICNGAKKAATQSFFTKSGKRLSGHLQICLTCKGRGWITRNDMEQAKQVHEL